MRSDTQLPSPCTSLSQVCRRFGAMEQRILIVTEDEATIATDRFDPTLREGLRDFFTIALRRNAEERFGNAEDMLRDWRRAFEPLDRGAVAEDSIETIARRLDRRSTIAELGYSVEARDVLDRMGVHTVQQLLAVESHPVSLSSQCKRQGASRDSRARQASCRNPTRTQARRWVRRSISLGQRGSALPSY